MDEHFDWDETMAGSWNGIRADLMRIGITPTMSYVGVLQTNAAGGPHRIWSYAGQATLSCKVDLEKSSGWRGLSSYVGMSWGTGSNLADSLGTTLPLNGLYAPSFYLGELYLQRSLLGTNLKVAAGRLTPSNSFASLPVFGNYVTYGINPNPFSLGANDISFFGPPTGTEWGAQGSYRIAPAIQVVAGAFNTNVHSANGKDHGADFVLQEGNKGALVVGELDYLRDQQPSSKGRPGQYAIGLLHSNNAFPSLSSGTRTSNGYSGVYLMGQQMIYGPDGMAGSRGLTIWGAWTRNSKEEISQMPVFAGAGVSYQGLVPARRGDVVSAGYIYGAANRSVLGLSSEQLFELNYQWKHSRYMIFSPQFQYVRRPGGANRSSITVAGIQVAITL